MLTVQKILFLRKVELFASLNADQLGHLASIAEEMVFQAATPIFAEGDYGEAMYVVVDGEVRIHRGTVQLTMQQANSCFGEMTLLDGEPRSASATAATDSLLLRLTQSEFQGILSANFEAVLAILRTLSQRIRKVEGRERELRRELEGARKSG